MEICGLYLYCICASASSGRSLATLSLPIGIHTYFMMRALGTLSRTLSGLAAGNFGAADGCVMIGIVIICKMLSSTFFAMDTTVLRAAVSTLCTNSYSYSIACLVPSPISLLVRLVIAEVSLSSLDFKHLR